MGFWVCLDSGSVLSFFLAYLRRFNHWFNARLDDLGFFFKWLCGGLLGHRPLAFDRFLVDGVGCHFKDILNRLDRLKYNESKSARL